MTLHPSGQRRERICVFGPSGSGKTSCWTTIAKWIHQTGSPAQMFVVDTDGTSEASVPEEWMYEGGGNKPKPFVHVYPVENFDEIRRAHAEIKPKLDRARNDWYVVDMVDKYWSWTQDAFFEKGYGVDPDDFFIDARKKALARVERDGNKGDAIGDFIAGDRGINWQVINKMYGPLASLIKYRAAHVFVCAPVAMVTQPDKQGRGGDAPEIIAEFGRLGVKPQGQKDLPGLFNTVLYMQEKKGKDGVRVMTTVKERNPPGVDIRPYQKGVELTLEKDFVAAYLFGVAKWRP